MCEVWNNFARINLKLNYLFKARKKLPVIWLTKDNNKLEGWHRAIQTLLDGPHPSIWRFFSAIQKEEGLQNADLTALMAGQEIQKQKKKYKDVNDRLKILIENYDNDAITREEFVRGVSHNINLNI